MFKFRNVTASICFAMAGLLLTFALPAYAYFKKETIPPLDSKVAMSKEEFYAASDLKDVKFDDDPDVNYRFRLPKGWIELPSPKTDNVSLNAELFSDISNYVSPARGDIRSRFRVRSLELKHLVSAENWFLNYTLSLGTNIDGIKVKSDRSLESQYTVLDKGQTYQVRASAQVSGSRIVVAEYLVPAEYAVKERDQQIWTVTSFALTSPNSKPIEDTNTYSFVDIVKFDYPQSWMLYSPPILAIDRMNASILNLHGVSKELIKDLDIYNAKMDARIDVRVIAKSLNTNEMAEIALLKQEMKEKGIEIGDLINTVPGVRVHRGVLNSKADAYKVNSLNNKLARYEIWVGILETKGRYYLITMLTVGREENFYAWAQNMETYKHVLKTLAPANDVN